MSASIAFGLLPLLVHLLRGAPPLGAHLEQPREDMALVQGGTFAPTLPLDPSAASVQVDAFFIDRDVVRNREFLAFVLRQPDWQRGRISPLFAEPSYLRHWAGPTSLGPDAAPNQPVVRVSWFAAKAYCEARGARLPTEIEWQYASAANEKQRDARRLPEWRRVILDWYSRPSGELRDVGKGTPNAWGVRDLHGLVWEWVQDFNSMLASGDSRAGGDTQLFCGAGAVGAGDGQDYAAFMRMAFLTSLKASYVAPSLGFRCARPANTRPPS